MSMMDAGWLSFAKPVEDLYKTCGKIFHAVHSRAAFKPTIQMTLGELGNVYDGCWMDEFCKISGGPV